MAMGWSWVGHEVVMRQPLKMTSGATLFGHSFLLLLLYTYISIYIYTPTCIHVYMYIHTHTHIYTHTYIYMHTYIVYV